MLQISKATPKPKNNNDSAHLRAMILSLKQNARKIQAVDAASLKVFKVRLDWGSEQPDLVEGVPAHARGVGI